MTPLLTIDGLTVRLPVEGEMRTVLRDVSLSIGPAEAVGLVGESGSGKSMTARAIARLLPDGAAVGGTIEFDGQSVLDLRGAALRRYRTDGIAMIFQDPRAHTNPVRKVGDFLTEAMRTNRSASAAEARSAAIEVLGAVGIDDAERRMSQYPHELSGGLLQRMMIAATLLMRPRLILADEPTTALDVTTQSEVMAILSELRHDHDLALLFITHDLELAAAVCDRTAVMYAGELVEQRDSNALHDDPLHPYTAALVQARPSVDGTAARLAAIPGRPLSAFEAPDGCAFATRCAYVEPACEASHPEIRTLAGGLVRCRRADELRGSLLAGVPHG